MNIQQLILTMAPCFEARDHVPILDYWSRPEHVPVLHDGTLLVWSGASDHTIYGDAKINHAFRAWHDACHLQGNYGFTFADERATCELQIRQALQLFPRLPANILRLIRAEVIGQAEYFADHGFFPTDQHSFVRDNMKLYEILIPECRNLMGASYEPERKQFERYLMQKIHGYSRFPKIAGAWANEQGFEYYENMIPYRVFCDEDTFAEIVTEALLTFNDQVAIMIVELGDAKIVYRDKVI